MANAFAGAAVVHSAFLRLIGIRVCKQRQFLMASGWRSTLETTVIIEWVRHECNAIADHAATVALDLGADWLREESNAGVDKG